jgi:hypothetical protein
MPLPSLKDVGVLIPPQRPCRNDNDNATTSTTTTTTTTTTRQHHVISPPHHWLNATSAKRRERGGGSGATRLGSKIPTAALAMPTPYCKPICIGSTSAQGSMIPTAAPVALVSTTGWYDIQYLHAAPSTSLNPLIGGYIFFCSDIVDVGQCDIHTPPPSNSLWNNLSAAALSMGGDVTSTRRPLRTHFGIILSAAVSLMEGGVISTHHPL